MGQSRTGTPILPTVVSTGTDGSATLPRVVTFPGNTRPVLVYNNTGNGNPIRVKLNSSDATDFGGGSDDGPGHFEIADTKSVEVSLGGILSIKRVSVVTTAGGDDLDNVPIVGWDR